MKGAIIGDIVGSIYEFDNTGDYDFPLFSPRCEFTDDTVCTVAVADALMNGTSYEDSLRSWCQRYPSPMGGYGGMFGRWLWSLDAKPYGSFGNGSAMRVSPVAWLCGDEAEVRRQAEASAAPTHNHPEGIKGAVAIAVAIFRMLHSEKKDPAIFTDTAREFYGADALDRLPRKGYFAGTCQEAVPLALHLAFCGRNFEDSLRSTVAYGGDTDTMGDIVGALAEARFGIPEEIWLKARSFLTPDILAVVDRFDARQEEIRR